MFVRWWLAASRGPCGGPAPAFEGQRALQDEFLAGLGADFRQPWTWEDTLAAHGAWNAHIRRRRTRDAAERPIADILIGAFSLRFGGLVTRNPDDFRRSFPDLEVRVP
ncbi:MAG: type II toxin-antitoxin system VapC family toxin [Acidobacteria bacterium]|nr:type II toxin-antitoxin system VapC family toxin [Acidobacteriota bacterium]